MRKCKNFWTKEKCNEEALKYNTRGEFKKNSTSAYNKSLSKKWINEICFHMIKIKNVKEYWNKEKCQEEALKYTTRSEFQKNNGSAFLASATVGKPSLTLASLAAFFIVSFLLPSLSRSI